MTTLSELGSSASSSSQLSQTMPNQIQAVNSYLSSATSGRRNVVVIILNNIKDPIWKKIIKILITIAAIALSNIVFPLWLAIPFSVVVGIVGAASLSSSEKHGFKGHSYNLPGTPQRSSHILPTTNVYPIVISFPLQAKTTVNIEHQNESDTEDKLIINSSSIDMYQIGHTPTREPINIFECNNLKNIVTLSLHSRHIAQIFWTSGISLNSPITGYKTVKTAIDLIRNIDNTKTLQWTADDSSNFHMKEYTPILENELLKKNENAPSSFVFSCINYASRL